jgi:hypothetical protein
LEGKETTPLNPVRGHYDTPSIDDEKDHLSPISFPKNFSSFIFIPPSQQQTTKKRRETTP